MSVLIGRSVFVSGGNVGEYVVREFASLEIVFARFCADNLEKREFSTSLGD